MIMKDFHCKVCDIKFESLVCGDEKIMCKECGGEADPVLSAPRIGLYNDPVARAAALRSRSYQHSVKEARANPEKLAKQMGGKPKSINPWNGRKRTKKSE